MRGNVLSVCFLVTVLSVSTAAYAQFGYHFGRNKIQYEHFDWQILKTPHFDIYFYPEMEALARIGAAFAEEAYEALTHKFALSLTYRVPLIFYSSHLHFQQTNITPGFIPEGVGGFFEFMKGRVVIPSNGDLHRFRRVIWHELVHVFSYSKVLRVLRDHRVPPDRFLPLWFSEGLAEYWSGESDYQHEMIMRDAIASNYQVPLENMYRILGTYLMYKEGEAWCRFVAETYGEEMLLRLIENIWKDWDFKRIIEYTFQRPFYEVSDAWDTFLRKEYYPALPRAEVPSLVSTGVAVEGFNSKPVVYVSPQDSTRMLLFMANKTGYTSLFAQRLSQTYQPIGKPEVLVVGERSEIAEAFHVLDSQIDVSRAGRLAFSAKSGGQDVIHIYDLEQRKLVHTLRFPELIMIYSPNWSPDGKQLTFNAIDRSGFNDLYIYHLEEGYLRRLTKDWYDDRDPAWSPDGRWLVFSSDRTVFGKEGAYNLFLYDLTSDDIKYLTASATYDLTPRWSPDGTYVIFSRSIRNQRGRFEGPDIWVLQLDHGLLASATPVPHESIRLPVRQAYRLTRWVSGSFDPFWTIDNRLVFTAFEEFRFTIRDLGPVQERLRQAKAKQIESPFRVPHTFWSFRAIPEDQITITRYKRRYNLDFAQSQISQNPVWGTTGGAFIAISDMLSDDQWYITLYNTANTQSDFLRSLNVSVLRLQLHRRANVGYGIYRFAGIRYDLTDPDAPAVLPVFWETLYGATGLVSYPLSTFKRLEIQTSLNWSDKDVFARRLRKQSLLLSDQVSLIHDNALYGLNGPVDGWRGNLTLAYTSDIRFSNVNYFTFIVDLRKYFRLSRYVTLASWGLLRINEGKSARLFILGGSWDLRGYPFFGIRGQKMWFTSHELRFPLIQRPSLYMPLLSAIGVANIRGALFIDAAHAWNKEYSAREPQLGTGETLGSIGGGIRVNLFGALVLRYDIGYRYYRGFKRRSPRMFKQFFFGWDF